MSRQPWPPSGETAFGRVLGFLAFAAVFLSCCTLLGYWLWGVR